MTDSLAPSLDDLLVSENPAWLWDGERARIVWANPPGVSFFGGETLFDLLDMLFDSNEAAIAEISRLTAEMERREQKSRVFRFTGSENHEAIACNCFIHSLADGRTGLLVVASGESSISAQLPDEIQTSALINMPYPCAIVSGKREVLFENLAMRELFGDGQYSFAMLVENNAELAGAHKSGIVQKNLKAETGFGQRQLKMLIRRLEANQRLVDSNFIITLEDITERRALERSLLAGTQAEAPVADKEDDDVETRLSSLKQQIEDAAAETEAEAQNRTEAKTEPKADETAETEDKSGDKQDAGDATPVRNVPEIVSKTLNALPQPLIIYNEDRQVLFANKATLDLLGAKDWQMLNTHSTIGDALGALEGEDGSISLFGLDDEVYDFDVNISTFPWEGGPVFQATLSLNDPPASQDNKEPEVTSPASQKKTTKFAPLKLVANNKQPIVKSEPVIGPDDEELRAILDTASDGIITLDHNGRICSFSAGAEALFGVEAGKVASTEFAGLMTKDSASLIRQYLSNLGEGGIASVFNDGLEVEAEVQGGILPLFITIGRLGTSKSATNLKRGGSAAYCVVVHDITQWKKTEAELREAKEKAEQSSLRKSEFLANVSHELRTPLNAIMGFSEVMRSERFGQINNPRYMGYVNDIHTSGEHLLSLINDLLDLSKVEAGKLELNFTSINLLNIIDDAINSVSDLATSNRVIIRKSVSGKLPNVVADQRSMKQILLNLLSNAAKFTGPGGQVVVSAKVKENGELTLTIKDTGPGMNEAEVNRALKPFEQLDSKTDFGSRGTGLGLPLTKALTEANRASFKIKSTPGKGTRISITFPTTRVLAE